MFVIGTLDDDDGDDDGAFLTEIGILFRRVIVEAVDIVAYQIEKSIAYTVGQSDYMDELRQIQNLTSRVILLYATWVSSVHYFGSVYF